MSKIKKKKIATTPNCGKYAEKLDTGENVKWSCHSGKQFWPCLKNKPCNDPITQQLSSWRFIPEKWSLTFAQKPIYNLYSSCICNSQNLKTAHKGFKGWMDFQMSTHTAGEWLAGFTDGDPRLWLWDTSMRTPCGDGNGPYLDFYQCQYPGWDLLLWFCKMFLLEKTE